MINLVSIDLSNNRIKHIAIDAFTGLSLIDLELKKFTFNKANRLESIDLSYNQIEYIHSLAFNQTILNYLNSAGNLFSSFDQINSFFYSILSTISTLPFSNCANLFEINWFIITKLEKLYTLDLSTIHKTNRFWLYKKIDVNHSDDDSFIN
ncbi:unnamed protein product [Rotaria sp. Silwood1]|nr:unnamed protein product [Rotaria sp. Silwood1]CAF1357538.1 unnamed protein product [Rotaria sp. Silwood1]CAF3556500.1 unnamed protein product [Rotaria sp. Silwood1]CAF4687437.1 unnamed protein product [Rotaria sp. Silwood1]CAF4771059.1 unnamed protein product [Rotaria sp. Silwood1]